MIKVIKQGTPPSKKIMKGTCFNCKTEIECEQGDARWEEEQRFGNYYVTCPVCSNSMRVEEKK